MLNPFRGKLDNACTVVCVGVEKGVNVDEVHTVGGGEKESLPRVHRVRST